MYGVPVVRGDKHHLHGVDRAEQLLVGLHAARTAQRTQRRTDLVLQLIIAAACRQNQTVEHALHTARNAAVVHRRREYDAVRLNALGDDFIYTVVVLHAAQRAIVQAVIARHARMHLRPRLTYLKLDALLLEHLAEHLEHLRTVAVLARRAVDCYNFHILFLRVFSIFSACPHCF